MNARAWHRDLEQLFPFPGPSLSGGAVRRRGAGPRFPIPCCPRRQERQARFLRRRPAPLWPSESSLSCDPRGSSWVSTERSVKTHFLTLPASSARPASSDLHLLCPQQAVHSTGGPQTYAHPGWNGAVRPVQKPKPQFPFRSEKPTVQS